MDEVGVEQVHGRAISLFELSNWTWDSSGVPPHPFTLLVAADASADDTQAVETFATAAITSGCRYVCTWGLGCDRVHDLFDKASIETSQFVMSTWHDQEALYEALYYSLVLAVPEDSSAAEAAVVLAVAGRWLPEVRRLVANQDELARLWVEEQ
jgi:hypothetical protein